jgi:hypothetical protein
MKRIKRIIYLLSPSYSWQYAELELKNNHSLIAVLFAYVYSCVLTGEVTNTNFIVFGLTRSGLEPTIYHKRANRYTTDVVIINQQKQKEKMFPGGATCLPTDCCFNELALCKCN